MQQEIPLAGGTANGTLVVRVGDTVRRPPRRTSLATHAVLRHLRDAGFEGAPRFLGIDDQGREVLSYIEGETVLAPYPSWVLSPRALVSVARLLCEYHQAVAGFRDEVAQWPRVVPAQYREGLPDQVISHNDPSMSNVVFRDGIAVALIDFDLASPGSRLWDLACAVRLWAPLRPPAYVQDERRRCQLQRLRAFVDAYGMAVEPEELADAVRANLVWCADNVRENADLGHAGFGTRWYEGEAVETSDTLPWMEATRADLLAALG